MSTRLYLSAAEYLDQACRSLGFDGATTVDMGGDLVALTGPNPEGLTGQMYVFVVSTLLSR